MKVRVQEPILIRLIRNRFLPRLFIAALGILFVLGCSEHQSQAGCNPFGNPPARLIAEVEPRCWGGRRLGPWHDSDGTSHYACIFEPKSSAAKPLPLVVYIHPSLLPASSIYLTNLLKNQNSADLSGDPARHGFIVLAPAGRNTTHFYPYPDDSGKGWDNWYRQFNPAGDLKIGDTTYKENVDAAAIDYFIEEVKKRSKVDSDRIFLTGWSNGAAMALIYGLNRPAIAAAAVYSAPDPYGALTDPCPQQPVLAQPANERQIRVFNPHVALMHIHNACDLAGICPNGEKMKTQLEAVGIHLHDVIVDGFGNQVASCRDSCGTNPNGEPNMLDNPLGSTLGFVNHARWPYGWTQAMLDFFSKHSLSARHQSGR